MKTLILLIIAGVVAWLIAAGWYISKNIPIHHCHHTEAKNPNSKLICDD